jgi:ectoine hydroxylase-related dioxygenase (phytanoyl-CoA dioxygenase family)
VPVSVLGSLQYADAILRLYGHPRLLAVAAAVNGDDFVPFTEAIVVKKPGEGAIIGWHQDGMTHWDSPEWDEGSHGFNFMAQLYPSTPATGVWFVPGSHAKGRADIKAMAAAAGSERLPQAVPLVCNPGDVAMSNRQIIHGSFANTSKDWRITFNMGFNRRSSVLSAPGFNFDTGERVPIDPERIRKRAEMIGYAIDARRQRFPEETAFVYRPHVEAGERYRWDDAARRAIRGYNALDIIV